MRELLQAQAVFSVAEAAQNIAARFGAFQRLVLRKKVSPGPEVGADLPVKQIYTRTRIAHVQIKQRDALKIQLAHDRIGVAAQLYKS